MGRFVSWLPSVVAFLSFLLLLTANARAAAAPDASPSEAGVADAKLEASPSADASDTADAGPTLEERARHLRAVLANLELLLAGKMPAQGYIEDLFPIDLAGDKAVEVARKDLNASLADWEKKLASLQDAPDAGLDAAHDAPEVDAGVKDAGVKDAGVKDAGVKDAALDGDAEPTDVDAGEVIAEATVIGLELQVARARLTFLKLPAEKRQALLAQDAERKRVALEKERANAEREKALTEQRRAEAARQKALAEAERAHNELQRVIANEHARMEGVRGAHAVYRRELAERRQDWATTASAQLARIQGLTERTRTVAPGSAEADALYDEIVAELMTVRSGVRDGLAAYQRVPEPARYVPDVSYDAIRSKMPEKERSAVEGNVRELSESASEMESEARNLAWDTLMAAVAREDDLNARRIDLLDVVTPDKRDAILGFGMEGLSQLRRELDRVELEGLWYRAHAEVRLRSLGELVKNPLWVGQVTWSVLLLVVLVGSVIYVRRRGPAALERIRVSLVRSVRRPAYARPLTVLIDALVAVLAPLALLLGVILAQRALGESAHVVELAVPLRLLLWFASYRLFIVASHRLLYRVIGRSKDSGSTSGGRSERLTKSVRMVARYGFGVAIGLILAAEILGEGYLYHLVLRFAWLGAIPIFALLVRWWRSDIADAYLAHRSDGRLASLVRSTRNRWFGFFVAAAAFMVVLGQATLRALRRFVLGFEQTRKALAFLFRRRLERRAAETTEAPQEEHLPEDLRRWFSEAPVSDETYAVTDLPGLEKLEQEAKRWADGEKSAAMLVVGEAGFGKTSWLNAAAQRVQLAKVVRWTLENRLLTEADMLRFLSRALNLDLGESPSRTDVIDAISKSERRIVIVDDAHHLVLRGVGTFSAWDAFADVVERTRFNTLWVAAMGGYAHQYLAWARGGVEPFRTVVKLGAWNETRVSLLIHSRSRESGYEMVYDDLVVDKLEGVEGEAQLVSTQEGYTRLIWDYADGCPRVALHCWKNSLVEDGDKRVRVRLFRRPNTNQLEALSEVEKFVLGSVVWHTTLTLEEAVVSLNLVSAICTDAFDKLHDTGILEQRDGRYRVVTRWLCPVARYLRRKHLVEE